MKRQLSILLLALCLCTPAHAIAPLAAIVLAYVKNAVKEKAIGIIKEQVEKNVPGGQFLVALANSGGNPMALFSAWQNVAMTVGRVAAEAKIADARGTFDKLTAGDSSPLTEIDWKDYAALLRKASGSDTETAEGIAEMRVSLKEHPEMNAVVRNTLNRMREMARARKEAFEAYAGMTEAERAEIVAAFVADYRKLTGEERDACKQALADGSMELPGDLAPRLLAAVRAA
jgi:hypothetical protein